MKKKINALVAFYKAHPKRFWVGGIVLILVLFMILGSNSGPTVTVVPVTNGTLASTVRATGQVTSKTDLTLAFSTSDIIRAINVSVGDTVYKGQALATLDNRDEYASLKAAQAKYNKVAEGASNEEIAVAQAALDSAQTDLASTQKVQDTLVENARRAYYNADLTPALTAGSYAAVPTVTGTYTGTEEGTYRISINVSGESYVTYSGVESGINTISTSAPAPLGTKGLFIQFPPTYSSYAGNVWTVSLPNTNQSPGRRAPAAARYPLLPAVFDSPKEDARAHLQQVRVGRRLTAVGHVGAVRSDRGVHPLQR
jgi:hypothetical protein